VVAIQCYNVGMHHVARSGCQDVAQTMEIHCLACPDKHYCLMFSAKKDSPVKSVLMNVHHTFTLGVFLSCFGCSFF
jgi:hypothetical protein